LATCIGSISGGGSSGRYNLLDRVKDDSNNEIGTVSGFFTDANNVEYAVVCLDAQYRKSMELYGGGVWSDSNGIVTDLPCYNIVSSNVWEAKETATFNTQKIIDWCSANNHSSSACSDCRSKNFIIGGTVYYGQLPNLVELVDIYKHQTTIDTVDTSASSNPDTLLRDKECFSSNQYGSSTAWIFSSERDVRSDDKTYERFTIPILEIPNAVS
jgi:hypothetical protein